jgi:hypothetical protein
VNSPTPVPSPRRDPADEERRFVEQLVVTGQLADVDESVDASKLPARITHIRFPNGTVKRIRFTGVRGN